jgi:HSP20 family protein
MMLHNGAVRELDQLTARVFTGRTPCVRLDAHRDGDAFVVDIDLPAGPAGVEVSTGRDAVTIRATSRDAAPEDKIADAAPEEKIALAETLDTDRIDARYDHGELTVRIPVITGDRLPAAA